MPPNVMGKNIAPIECVQREDKRYAGAANLRALGEDGHALQPGIPKLRRAWRSEAPVGYAAGVIMSARTSWT